MPCPPPRVPQSPLTWSQLPGADKPWPIRVLLDPLYEEFLMTNLLSTIFSEVANLCTIRPATSRQYQSCWKSFQTFLRSNAIKAISTSTSFKYLPNFFHSLERSLTTVVCQSVILEDLLCFAYRLVLERRLKDLVHCGLFLQRAPPQVDEPQWTLI